MESETLSKYNINYVINYFLNKIRIFFNILSYVLWFMRIKVLDNQQEVSSLKPLIGILYGNGNNFLLMHNEPLWFFVCLFVTQIMLFFILKFAKTKLQIILFLFVFAVIGYFDSKYFELRPPWRMDVALTAVVFSGIGYIFKEQCEKWTKNRHIVFLLIVFFISISIAFLNGKIDMNYNKYNNIVLFYVGASSGIFFWVNVSIMLGGSNILKYIGNNSLTIFALHIPALIVIVKLLMIMGISYSIQANNVLFLFIHTYLTVLLLIPVNYFLNKYIPFLVGRRNV